jgi:hypothetical protein
MYFFFLFRTEEERGILELYHTSGKILLWMEVSSKEGTNV